MKHLIKVLIFIVFLPLNAEPLHKLLKEYALGYLSVSKEIKEIEEAVKEKYSETLFVMKEDGTITDVFSKDEVKDTLINKDIIKYDYEKLNLLIDEINRMIKASVPDINSYSKSIRIKENFLNSEVFKGKVGDFEYFLITLVEIASVIKEEDTLFLPQYDSLESIDDLKYWKGWYDVMGKIESLKIEKSLRNFEIRYGGNSEKINLIELLIINWIPPFKGDINGPSPWEPILRFTPICYNITDNRFIKTFQIGMNYYFLEGSFSFLKWLHHFGIAFVIGDTENQRIYQMDTKKLSFGTLVHLGKCQFGIIKDNRDNSLKLISTIDFQILPAIF